MEWQPRKLVSFSAGPACSSTVGLLSWTSRMASTKGKASSSEGHKNRIASLPWSLESLESLEPWQQEPWQNTIAILCTGRIRLVARTDDIGCLWAEDCWQTFRRFSKLKKNKQRLRQFELPRFKHCGYNGFTSDEMTKTWTEMALRSPLAPAYLKTYALNLKVGF